MSCVLLGLLEGLPSDIECIARGPLMPQTPGVHAEIFPFGKGLAMGEA